MSSKICSNSGHRLIFIGTTRLHYGSDGRLRSYNPVMSVDEWGPFLEVFEEILILARLEPDVVSDEGYVLDNPRIHFVPIPHYDGLIDFYRQRHSIANFVFQYIQDPSAVYCVWVPNPLALLVARKVSRVGAPLIVRVVGDSSGVAKAILPRPLNYIAAGFSARKARRAVKLADGVVYVTLKNLQMLYPPRRDALALARTNMKFSEELLSVPKNPTHKSSARSLCRVIAVGSQHQNYKGHDLLIEAVARLQREGHNLALTLVGDGRLHSQLQTQAQQAGVENIEFIQRLGSSLEVAQYISTFDLFAMPSRTEGMPKSLMEAMSVGVLSIGSSVGGIPELLDDECIFEPNSVEALQECIRTVIDDEAMARRQLNAQTETIKLVREKYSGASVMTEFLANFMNKFGEKTA